MPLGFERLNERTQRPNAHINFIRTLADPSSTAGGTAQSILNRVAAICYPFMKKHHIYVQALEEFPFNHEFVGRNFNAGEVIQLVLKNRRGQWLPERWVMMVMVHELAHCKQMNHSKPFWKVRDEYALELRALWAKGYTGEGLWGRGRALDRGNVCEGSVAAGDVPEHLCGGTYGRRRKRKRGGKGTEGLTYAEKKQRAILKKFGAGGQALGADDDTKIKLDGGVAKKGKPRVAGSARGRELRAAAALARFEQVKKEGVTVKEEPKSDSETEDEYEHAGADEAAIDVDGKKMVDGEGRALVKICEDEDSRDENARREMEEFADINLFPKPRDPKKPSSGTKPTRIPAQPSMKIKITPASAKAEPKNTSPALPCPQPTLTAPSSRVIHLDEIYKRRPGLNEPAPSSKPPQLSGQSQITCSICSLINEPGLLTCMACSNVLNPALISNHWRCRTAACAGSKYTSSGDAGVCGVCGTSRST